MGILFIQTYVYYFCVLSLVCEGVPFLHTTCLVCGDAQDIYIYIYIYIYICTPVTGRLFLAVGRMGVSRAYKYYIAVYSTS